MMMRGLKYAILGDVHANREALEAVLADAESQGVERYACVGDVVGYNADPKWCLAKVRELAGDAVVRGNHDHYCAYDDPLTGFHPLAADVVKWTRQQLDDSEREWLRSLRYSRGVETFMMVHGTLDNPEMWGYVFDKLEADVIQNVKTETQPKSRKKAFRIALRTALAVAAAIALFFVVQPLLSKSNVDDFESVELAFNNLSTDDQDFLLQVYEEDDLFINP